MDAYEKLARWALTDDTGVSSKSIGARWLGTEPRWGWGHPHDCGDFGRCYRLLQAMPQIDISIMRGVSAEWDKLVPAWPALTAAYEAALPEDGNDGTGGRERWGQFHDLLNAFIR